MCGSLAGCALVGVSAGVHVPGLLDRGRLFVPCGSGWRIIFNLPCVTDLRSWVVLGRVMARIPLSGTEYPCRLDVAARQ